MANWLVHHSTAITLWCAALCTFAIYSVLYQENKFYRFFEHVYIGLFAGYGVYITWAEVLYPKWWQPMVNGGEWYWIFAAVVGSMFYFMYSAKHGWISRVIFGLLMGFAAGGAFREFYETYFPQIGSSMKPIWVPQGSHLSMIGHMLTVLIFYVMLFASMSYFFFSFEHKNIALKKSAAVGRWFLMIGFGAIFGATVMGRMTLFIGRLDFLLTQWGPEVKTEAVSSPLWFAVALAAVASAITLAWRLSKAHSRSSTK